MNYNEMQVERGRTTSGQDPEAHPGVWRARACLLAVLLPGLFCGCESQWEKGVMAGSYYLDPYKDLRKLGRVALVELDNMSGYPEISTDMTDALFLAVQKKQIFGLSVIRQQDQDWRSLQENLDSLQVMRQLLTLQETLKCNGLLVGTVTQYQPYPHMVIALRLKLLDLTDGQILWGIEHVWDSTDKGIQKRIKAHFNDQQGSESAPLREDLVTVSALSFAKFVAFEVAETLEREERPWVTR
jgi:hypothetical protein